MAKGGEFELEIAKKLSLWYTEGKRDDLICRTDTSGGRATVRTKKKKETNKYLYGDLKHSDDLCRPLFDKWNIECKTGYASKTKLKDGTKKITNWDILDILDSKAEEPMFLKMWNQCVLESEWSRREPILIFRRNQKEILIVITKSYYLKLQHIFGKNTWLKISANLPKMFDPVNNIIIIKFSNFLKWIDANTIVITETL